MSMSPRALAVADQALLAGQYGVAMHGYLKAAAAMPALANTLAANLALTRHRFLTRPENSQGLRIVLSSQLAMGDGAESRIDRAHQHVPASQIRSDTLALFVDEMLWLVAERPAEVLHLCEVSGPNLIIGMLYRCLWGARVVIDVDADDRRLIEAEPAYDVANFWRKCFSETGAPDLCDDEWRMLARAVFRAFDAVTLDGFHQNVAKNDCFPALTSVLARVQAFVVEAKPLVGLVNQWVAALAYRPGAQAILPAAPVDTGVRWRACWPNRLVNKSLGFNLVGYATSPIGLGEDLRQSAVALLKAGIPISIIDVETDVSGTCTVGLERYIKQACAQPVTIFLCRLSRFLITSKLTPVCLPERSGSVIFCGSCC